MPKLPFEWTAEAEQVELENRLRSRCCLAQYPKLQRMQCEHKIIKKDAKTASSMSSLLRISAPDSQTIPGHFLAP